MIGEKSEKGINTQNPEAVQDNDLCIGDMSLLDMSQGVDPHVIYPHEAYMGIGLPTAEAQAFGSSPLHFI